jgi:uncharacterized protein (TIGR04255 family)
MNLRPPDLPDFGAPPVVEVVLGIQFNYLAKLLTPRVGDVWDLFRSEFPLVEEQMPLPPTFETFGQNPQLEPPISFRVMTSAELPRVFFLTERRTHLIQLQRDRFFHNWRKSDADDPYPRFESIRDTFRDGLEKFSSYVSESKVGVVEPTQCEISYINQVLVPTGTTSFDQSARMFGSFPASPDVPGLGRPEDGRFVVRYVIPDANDKPMARLLVNCEPGWRADGSHIIQLTLTVRGLPAAPGIDAVMEFLDRGREYIVRGFKSITSNEMHKEWKIVL